MFAECARAVAAVAFGVFALLGADAESWAQPAPDYGALLAAPDRSDADRQADKRRDPLPFLAFVGVRPGMKVLDMGAGGGYSTELMARAVAPGGIVYGQNPADLPEGPKSKFEARLKTSAMRDVVADVRPFDDPVPPDVHDLDLITFLFLPRHDLHERRSCGDGEGDIWQELAGRSRSTAGFSVPNARSTDIALNPRMTLRKYAV